jgi:hypothetical protein
MKMEVMHKELEIVKEGMKGLLFILFERARMELK